MLVIAILKIKKMAAPGTLTFMVSREHRQCWECRAAACMAWHHSVQLAFQLRKGSQCTTPAPWHSALRLPLKNTAVQMWSSKDCDSQFLEQAKRAAVISLG